MKISNKFKKLQEEDAFLVVAGKQDAAFYTLQDGEIERVDAFKIPTPRYSDNEGHSRHSLVASSWTKEVEDRDIIREFIQEFKTRLKKVDPKFKKLYLFVPSQTKNAVRKALPRTFKDKLAKEVSGNYYYRSPQHLLEKLSK